MTAENKTDNGRKDSIKDGIENGIEDSIKKTVKSEEKTSMYDYIAAAVVDGRLPEDFALPRYALDDSQIAWMDGAMDGVNVYHMGFSEISAENSALMAEAVQAASGKEFEKADQLFGRLGQAVRAINIIDELQEYVMEHKEELSASHVFEYAVNTVLHSGDRECVKFGISLLELFDTDDNDELKMVIRTLGLSDEFTVFAVFVMLRWENGNDEVYRLAREIHGWGRIHAIERIEPETEEIKKWLLTEGVHNAVMPAYSALTCWRKSDAENVLKGNPSRDEFCGIRDMIRGLLDEGPVSGISQIENAADIINAFLKQAAAFELNLEDYEAVREIRRYFEGGDSGDSAVAALCQELLTSDSCRALVTDAVRDGRAIELAEDLGLDFLDDILKLLQTSFDSHIYLCGLLIHDPKYRETVFELFRQKLPLEEMKTEPTKSLGLGQEFRKQQYLESALQELKRYPLEYPEFVETALQSAPIRTRNLGIAVLEAWACAKETPLAELMPEMHSLLCRLREIEPDEMVKSRMERLINGAVRFNDGTV